MSSNLETPTLPNPETVALDKLGLMSTFPPLENQRVDLTNSFKYPQMRWAVQHMRELYPTRNIRRGHAQVTDLQVALKPIGRFTFQDASEQLTSVDEWFNQNYLDALVVLHKGNIVFERYDNQMKPSSSHLLFSVWQCLV